MDSHEWIRTMSSDGRLPDNATSERFIVHLRNEMLHSHNQRDVIGDEFMAVLACYIKYRPRIKRS